MNIKLTISYDGTEFCGYQIQPNKRTVEQEIKTAIKKLTGEDTTIVASGRTDSGVHAKGQVVNFLTNSTIEPNKFHLALNSLLPSDVRVLSSKKVSENFNSRYCAKKKTYKYFCYFGEVENPIKSRYSVLLKYFIDLEKVKEACKIIEGTHDFKCFCSTGSSVKTTVRTIYKLSVQKRSNDLIFSVTGNGFLYNMVRIIVGTLISVGEGKITLQELESALKTGERSLVGKTMPPNGLSLEKVIYK